jgi:hypothetical protein
MLSVSVIMLSFIYAECHLKAHYAEYHYAKCRGASNGLPYLLLLFGFCLVNDLSDKANLPRVQSCTLFADVINEIV